MDFNKIDFNKFFQSQTFKTILICIAVIIAILLVLKLGIMIGSRKAAFSFQWGENYHRNFAGPREGFKGFLKGFDDRDFIDAHGVFGQIIKIDPSTSSGQEIIIKGRDNVEKIVLVKDNTTIERLRETIKISDLKADDYVVVIGEPNESGQIEAKFIRVMPPPPETSFLKPLNKLKTW